MNVEGYREILGVDVFTTEDGAGWTAFLRSLVARGLSGVQLVISDAHEGLKNAIAGVLAGASWQRCRTHFVRNLLTRCPEVRAGDGRDPRALDLRTARRRHDLGATRTSR